MKDNVDLTIKGKHKQIKHIRLKRTTFFCHSSGASRAISLPVRKLALGADLAFCLKVPGHFCLLNANPRNLHVPDHFAQKSH